LLVTFGATRGRPRSACTHETGAAAGIGKRLGAERVVHVAFHRDVDGP
jgi:hypothetical protein